MSNRSFATRYDGSSSVPFSGGGGADLFGLQHRRQLEILQLQQAQELEKMREAERLNEQGATHEAGIAKDKDIREVGLAAAKAAGLVPPSTSYDVLSPTQQKAINDLGMSHIALQQKVQDDPNFQKAAVEGATAVQAKPGLENNVLRGQAQSASKIEFPPNTGVSYQPGGDFTKPPATGVGATQKITTVGGITDPKTGQVIGGRPIETYGQPRFPVDRVDFGASTDSPTNNVAAKPIDTASFPLLSNPMTNIQPNISSPVSMAPTYSGNNLMSASSVMPKPPQASGPVLTDQQRQNAMNVLMQYIQQAQANQVR